MESGAATLAVPAGTTAEPAIRVRGLAAGYGGRPILEDLSFDVHRGEIFFILGGSGCGKSTVLKHLIGLVPPVAGEIRVGGVDVATADQGRLRELQRRIGVLFQSGALFGSLTLRQNVALPLEEYTMLPPDMVDLVVRAKLAMVKLSGFEDYLPSEISGGMKKRAGLARAMALDPDILFFDEPSAGLDPVTSAELDELILEINRHLGTTVVVVSHELASVFAIAHRVILLDREARTVIAEGDPGELRDRSPDPRVQSFFRRLPSHHSGLREHGD